jgi:hypothetical protein
VCGSSRRARPFRRVQVDLQPLVAVGDATQGVASGNSTGKPTGAPSAGLSNTSSALTDYRM